MKRSCKVNEGWNSYLNFNRIHTSKENINHYTFISCHAQSSDWKQSALSIGNCCGLSALLVLLFTFILFVQYSCNYGCLYTLMKSKISSCIKSKTHLLNFAKLLLKPKSAWGFSVVAIAWFCPSFWFLLVFLVTH